MTYDKAIFAANLTEMREAHGLTRKEVADACNSSVTTMRRWERGESSPPMLMAKAIADFLGFELSMTKGNGAEHGKTICRHEGECCMRYRGMCIALSNTEFDDHVCHFRKAEAKGVNLYDEGRRKKNANKHKGVRR